MMNQFNHEAVTRITRETIEHSLNFFNVINERLVEITSNVRPDMPLPRLVEETNKVCEIFLIEHKNLVARAENVWRETFAVINDPKNLHNTDTKVNPIQNLFDPNELLGFNRDILNTTVTFFTKAGESMFKALDPKRPVTTPKEVIDLVNKTRDEYVRRHQELVQHIENTLHHAINPNHPQTTTVDQKCPETPTVERIFDINEIVRINREVIDHTVRFFLDLNTTILDIVSHLEEPVTVRNHLETMTRTCDEYRRTHQTAIETIMNTTRETLEKTIVNHDPKLDLLNTLINRDELFKLNQETINVTVKFFQNLNEELVRSIREPGRQINLDTLVTDYQRNHHILATRIVTILHETLDRLVKLQTPEHCEQTIDETPKAECKTRHNC
ncbi:MAG TPA: hypothetical protein PKM25_10800 [Candidatus Ozemobacteraceae bacterium]|nr:hypothetical protein [Candidatus Ozemobacteraceae bacterium]